MKHLQWNEHTSSITTKIQIVVKAKCLIIHYFICSYTHASTGFHFRKLGILNMQFDIKGGNDLYSQCNQSNIS